MLHVLHLLEIAGGQGRRLDILPTARYHHFRYPDGIQGEFDHVQQLAVVPLDVGRFLQEIQLDGRLADGSYLALPIGRTETCDECVQGVYQRDVFVGVALFEAEQFALVLSAVFAGAMRFAGRSGGSFKTGITRGN